MKKFYKGDTIARITDVDMHWGITPSQIIFVIEDVNFTDDDIYALICRPWYNWIKNLFKK